MPGVVSWFLFFSGLPELCVFFQSIMHYFLANYAQKVPNYANCAIFLSENF